MPYDSTGKWTPEDDSVESKVTGLMAPDNPYVMQAKTQAAQAANGRGMLNSSLAVQNGETAAYNAALPIASQDASQTFQKNVSSQGAQQQGVLNDQTIGAQKDLQTQQIASTEGMQTKQIAATAADQAAQTASTEKIAGQQISSQQTMQAADIQAQNDRLVQQLGSQQALQDAQLAAQKQMQGEQLTAQEQMQVQQLDAAKANLATQVAADATNNQATIASNQAIAALDSNTRTALGQLDSDTQTRIANMNVTADQRDKAMTMAVAISSNYANEFAAIANNANIPAATRDLYLQNAAAQRDSDLSLIEQMFGTDLSWINPTTGATSTSTGTVGGADTGALASNGGSTTTPTTGGGVITPPVTTPATNPDGGTGSSTPAPVSPGQAAANAAPPRSGSGNTPIQDIAQALKAGLTVSDASWRQAGFGPGGLTKL